MYKSKLIVILLVLVLLQLSVCRKQKKEPEQEIKISQQEELQRLAEEIQVEEETPDTFQIEEISYRHAEVAKIKKVDMTEIEATLSSPVQINYINWNDSWTPKQGELPNAVYWDFFDSTRVKKFSSTELDALANHGFFIEFLPPKRAIVLDDMVDHYLELLPSNLEYSIIPIYVSSDFLLHVFHLLFDRSLQDIERKKFMPLLMHLTAKLYARSKQDYEVAGDSLTKQAALKNQAYFAVASKLLTNTVYTVKKEIRQIDFIFDEGDRLNKEQMRLIEDGWKKYNIKEDLSDYISTYADSPMPGEVIPESLQNLITAEYDLIMDAKGFASSPLFGPKIEEDYSQYRPRGHYTISEDLSSYFRTMMWYGRIPFSVEDETATLQAILITIALQNPELENCWSALMTPIDFLIGESEDLGVNDYQGLIKDIYGNDPSLQDLAYPGKLTIFQAMAKELPKKRIPKAMLAVKMPEKAFRFMGQRLVPDAEIFSKLTSPRVGTDDSPRNMPKAFDVMAVFGSSLADKMLAEDKSRVFKYADSLQALKTYYQKLPDREWQRNTYWCWLNTLRPLLQEKDQRFPFFMRGLYWLKKSLLTALSSWGELKHDTILYAAQIIAEMGEGYEEPLPPTPHSYVEPDLEFFNRLIYLTEKTFKMLSMANLLSNDYYQKIAEFLAKSHFLREIVCKELQNISITKDEYKKILQLIKDFELIVSPPENQFFVDDRFKRMAIVSDVHTDAISRQVLTVAVGTPQRIYVAVKDNSGGNRVTVGYIFSYYEFPQPMNQRMTDEEWQALVYGGADLSDKEPDWISELRVPNQK